MPLTTVTVSIAADLVLGTPLPLGTVRFELTAADIDGAIVAPQPTTVTLDANGLGAVALWPNARGTQGTQYRVIVRNAAGELQLSALATVPASSCYLHDILNLAAPAVVDDAQAAAMAAQGYASQAGANATSTHTDRMAADADAVATAADRVQTGQDRAGAGTSAAAAAASRTAIDNRIYPGTYAVAPTTRPDGSAIQNGDEYFGTDGFTYVRVSGAWANQTSAAASSAAAALASQIAAASSEANGATSATASASSAAASAASGKVYASIAAAQADGTLANGSTYFAPLPNGSLQAYTKVSSSSSTAIGQALLGAPAMSTADSDLLAGALPIGRNIFDVAAATVGSVIRSTTGVAAAGFGGNFFATDYIKIPPGGQFIANKAIYGDGSQYGIAYYDSTKTFVSGVLGAVAANTAITAPSNAAYVRFAVNSALKSNLMVNLGAAIGTWREHDFTTKFGQRQEFSTRVQELLRTSPNLFNPATASAGAVVSSTSGVQSANASFFATDYMPVNPGTIVFNQTSIAGPSNGIAFYDAALTYLSGIAGPVVASTQYTVPEGAAYARATFQTAASNNAPMYQLYVVQGTSVPASFSEWGATSPYGASRMAQALDLVYQDPSLNLFDRSRITNTASALLAGGAVSTNPIYAAFSITDFMPVVGGTNLVASKAINNGSALAFCWYDRSKNYVSCTTGNVAAGAAVAVPDGVFYFRTTIGSNDAVEFPLIEIYNANALPTSPGFGLQDLRLQRQRWSGKNLVTHGDSITASTDGRQQWARGVAYMLKAILLANYGVSGTKMYQALAGRVAGDYTNADLTTIALATNDYNGAGSSGGTPIGAITDTPSNSSGASFYAAGRYNIETLLGWKPTMALALYTPFRRGSDTTANTLGFVLKDYRDAVIALGNYYSIPVLDLYMDAGLNILNFSTYMLADASYPLHPTNQALYDRVINRTAKFLERI